MQKPNLIEYTTRLWPYSKMLPIDKKMKWTGQMIMTNECALSSCICIYSGR